ncbi:hypothetical protein L3D22_00225 [Lysobacter soli]|uniref:hypothetical protein n=1 Tax=Lysobacter soli TaxID=453783 RepID=UPI00209F2CDF|nr:hypothetical protein [Lysobacter soli]UTA54336.1 hypothetical protein L3D22_00225 [Lysobacter soli]
MNAEELAGIPVWVGREVVERQIPRLYAELAAAVQNNANGSRQAFENERLRLVEELARADLTSLTEAQDRFLREKLHLLEHLGEHGIQEVEGVLFRNSLDVVTAASEINRIAGEVTNAIDRSSQIKAALSGLIDPFKAPDDEIVLRVVFDHDASINDIVDLKKWAQEWHDIGRGVAMAVGASPKEIRVVGAQTGSIILTLATTLAIARVVSSVLLKALEVAEKVQGLRKAELEIQALKLANSQAVDAIRAQADAEKRAGLEDISQAVAREHLNLDGERLAALEKSVAKLVKFIEKGGEVDVVLPITMEQMEEPQGDALRLKKDVTRIRELEQAMRALPYISGGKEEGDEG